MNVTKTIIHFILFAAALTGIIIGSMEFPSDFSARTWNNWYVYVASILPLVLGSIIMLFLLQRYGVIGKIFSNI